MAVTRRNALLTGAAGVTAMMSAAVAACSTTRELPKKAAPAEAAGTPAGSRVSARITPVGERVSAVFLDAGEQLLGCRDLSRSFTVAVTAPGVEGRVLTVARAYTRATASVGGPESGRYVVLELGGRVEDLVSPYTLVDADIEPMQFREYAPDGSVVQKPRVQKTSAPKYLGSELTFTVTRVTTVVSADGGQLAGSRWDVVADADGLDEVDLMGFDEGEIRGAQAGNTLRYRFRSPAGGDSKAPLVVFLHGSGQVGNDNLAHVVSSRGAVGVLDYEDAYVVAPQAPTVFDDFDTYDAATGKGGGIHWQSQNRRNLVTELVRRLMTEHPQIDRKRVYLHGLSRGAEGALYLVLDQPELFAAVALFSGREAGTIEWMDGHATPDLLRPALATPLWFFHAAQDKVSPVTGTRKNVDILRSLGHPNLRYTELSYEKPGDSGYVNESAHNSWDLGYDRPDVWRWLLAQQRS